MKGVAIRGRGKTEKLRSTIVDLFILRSAFSWIHQCMRRSRFTPVTPLISCHSAYSSHPSVFGHSAYSSHPAYFGHPLLQSSCWLRSPFTPVHPLTSVIPYSSHPAYFGHTLLRSPLTPVTPLTSVTTYSIHSADLGHPVYSGHSVFPSRCCPSGYSDWSGYVGHSIH